MDSAPLFAHVPLRCGRLLGYTAEGHWRRAASSRSVYVNDAILSRFGRIGREKFNDAR
jgi:hypothetical protein